MKFDYASYGRIVDEDSGVSYRAVITEDEQIGFRAIHPDGRVEYIMLNPSGGSDDGVPTVFVYIDADAPTLQNAVHHYVMFDKED